MHFTKATGQTLHAIRRARERYSWALGLIDIVSIKDMICGTEGFDRKHTILVKRQSNRVSVWKVFYKNEWYGVVFDSKRQTLVTVLPKGAVDQMEPGHSF